MESVFGIVARLTENQAQVQNSFLSWDTDGDYIPRLVHFCRTFMAHHFNYFRLLFWKKIQKVGDGIFRLNVVNYFFWNFTLLNLSQIFLISWKNQWWKKYFSIFNSNTEKPNCSIKMLSNIYEILVHYPVSLLWSSFRCYLNLLIRKPIQKP